jgi:phage terminase small subunit
MTAPDELTGAALEFWEHNCPILEGAGVLTEADLHSFTLLCKTWQKVEEAEADGIDAIKWVALSKQLQNMLKAFGLTPESRRRLKIDLAPQTADEFGI